MENLDASSWTAPSSARWQGVQHGSTSSAAAPGLRAWAPWVVAALMFAGLMFSFLSVVQQAVDRAGHQQMQAEDRAAAETRCQTQSTYAQRQSCLAGVKAASSLASMR